MSRPLESRSYEDTVSDVLDGCTIQFDGGKRLTCHANGKFLRFMRARIMATTLQIPRNPDRRAAARIREVSNFSTIVSPSVAANATRNDEDQRISVCAACIGVGSRFL